MLIAGEWMEPADTDVNIAWTRDTYAAMAGALRRPDGTSTT